MKQYTIIVYQKDKASYHTTCESYEQKGDYLFLHTRNTEKVFCLRYVEYYEIEESQK